MGIWLQGWTGDNAGEILGRQPNTLLVALTCDDYDLPLGLFEKGEALQGMPWYWMIDVTCLTPGARSAIATNVEITKTPDAYAIEVAEIEWGGEEGLKPWEPGVHLFAVELWADQGPASTATFATAVIHSSLKRMSLQSGEATSALLSHTERLRQRIRASGTSDRFRPFG